MSLLIGFIDGDGSIWSNGKYSQIFVGCHCNWLDNLVYLFNRLYEILNIDDEVIVKNRVNKNNITVKNDSVISYIKISKRDILNKIKNRVITLNIPYMERKWGKIK